MSPVFKKDDYRYYIRSHEFLKIPGVFFRDIRYSLQRIRRGYSDADASGFCRWFREVVPDMLRYLEDRWEDPEWMDDDEKEAELKKHGGFVDESSPKVKKITELLRESSEDTREKRNPYEAEYQMAEEKFAERYGPAGEKLGLKDEDGRPVLCFSSMDPEFEDISDKYFEENGRLAGYEHECLEEAFRIMADVFESLCG